MEEVKVDAKTKFIKKFEKGLRILHFKM